MVVVGTDGCSHCGNEFLQVDGDEVFCPICARRRRVGLGVAPEEIQVRYRGTYGYRWGSKIFGSKWDKF